jgi:hypothetical protein
MKNFYNKYVLTYLLMALMVFSPLLTIAEVVEDTPAEEPVVEEVVVETPAEEPAAEEESPAEEETPVETDLISNLVDQVVEDLVEPLLVEQEAPTSIVAEEVKSNVTFVEKVELGVTYSYINNSDVQVTFTSLPENPGSLSIEEVILSDEQVEAFGALSDIAYDITSDMENGTFAYDLKLPLPEGVEEVSRVVYAESIEDLTIESASVESEKVEVLSDTVVVSDLDHFTIFVVVPNDIVTRPNFLSNIQGWSTVKIGNSNIG